MENWKIEIGYQQFRVNKCIYITRKGHDGKYYIWRGNREEVINSKEGESIKPSFEFTDEMLQQLVEVLDSKGFKPKQGFLEGKLEATDKHLQDMRNLVFKK